MDAGGIRHGRTAPGQAKPNAHIRHSDYPRRTLVANAAVLALDHPAVFRRCLAGEYESVTAAGRDAGLARSMPRRPRGARQGCREVCARRYHAALDADELGGVPSRAGKVRIPKRAAAAIFNGLDEREWRAFAKELVHLETNRERSRRPRSTCSLGDAARRQREPTARQREPRLLRPHGDS